eukprot:6214772-Pleurochrysis_carterae.AAC.3
MHACTRSRTCTRLLPTRCTADEYAPIHMQALSQASARAHECSSSFSDVRRSELARAGDRSRKRRSRGHGTLRGD